MIITYSSTDCSVECRSKNLKSICNICNADMEPCSNLVADDRLVFALDPQTVYQYDLRMAGATMHPRPGRGCRGLSVLPTLKSNEGLHASLRRNAPLRARLRPLLAQSTTSGQRNETSPVSLKHSNIRAEKKLTIHESRQLAELSDDEDFKIAQLGLTTGEDAVNYFTTASKDSHVKFVHLVPAANGLELNPYLLVVVPFSAALSRGEYFTMSQTGLVRCLQSSSASETECVSMNEWVRHSTFFSILRSINYFKLYLRLKIFRQWHASVRQKLFVRQQRYLSSRLLLARAIYCQPVIELKTKIHELRKAAFVAPLSHNRLQSKTLFIFMEQQLIAKKAAMFTCERIMKRVVDITGVACESVKSLQYTKDKSVSLPKELCALLFQKLEEGRTRGPPINSEIEERRAHKRLVTSAANDRGLLTNFVRLVDCIMVETVISNVMLSFTENLLANLVDTHHKVGLFEVTVGFESRGTTFSPMLSDFLSMSQRVTDDTITILCRIPRVLDSRSCIEHCPWTSFASKIDEVIHSLPLFRRFIDALRNKFRLDFKLAMHKAAVFDSVRPIYEESRSFIPRLYRSKARTFSELQVEFEQICAWQQELDKMRARESSGTIEATSRQLKRALLPFVEAKHGLLKSIIRDEARVQCSNLRTMLVMRVEVLEAIPKNLDGFASYLEQTGAYDEQEISRIRGPVDRMYTLLQMNEVKIPPDDLVALDEMHSLAARYSKQLVAAHTFKENEHANQSEQLDTNIGALNSELSVVTTETMSGNFVDVMHFDDPEMLVIKTELAAMHYRLEQLAARAQTYAGYKELFGLHADEFPQLNKATDRLRLVDRLWTSIADWHVSYSIWMRGDLTTLDAEEVDGKMQVLQADAFSLNRKVNSPVTEKFVLVIDKFKPVMPLIVDLGNPAMQSRHWEQLCKAMGKGFDPSTTFSLEDFLEWGITGHAELASDVSSTASGESQLEKGLEKMEAAWETLAFVTKEWRTSYILVSTDEIQQELDDQIVRTQAMRGSSAYRRPENLAETT